MVVVRNQDTGHVFGGYTPLDWGGTGSKAEPTRSSFVFLLRATGARAGEPPQKWHPRAGSPTHIQCTERVGPYFGDVDLYLCDGCDGKRSSEARLGWEYACDPRDNRKLAGGDQDNFLVDDYEVFQVGAREPKPNLVLSDGTAH